MDVITYKAEYCEINLACIVLQGVPKKRSWRETVTKSWVFGCFCSFFHRMLTVTIFRLCEKVRGWRLLQNIWTNGHNGAKLQVNNNSATANLNTSHFDRLMNLENIKNYPLDHWRCPKGSDFVILRNKFLGSTFWICFEGLLTYQFLHSKMMWRFYQILGAVIFKNTEYLVFFSKKRVFSKLMIEIIHF